MKGIVTFFLILFFQIRVLAQKNYTIEYQTTLGTYDSTKSTFSYDSFTLVIQDSIAYCYYPYFSTKPDWKNTVPLGSSYWPKMLYSDAKDCFTLMQEGMPDKPKGQRLIKRKCEKGNWIVTNEKKMICGYQCIEATGVYRNRSYTVWYSPDLPFNFGPFLFHGLPGTILESSDESGYFATATKVANGALLIIEPTFCKRVEEKVNK